LKQVFAEFFVNINKSTTLIAH